MRAVERDRGADKYRALEMFAQRALRGKERGLQPGDPFDLKTNVGELVADQFVAEPLERGVGGRGAEAWVVFLPDQFGDEENPARPGEVAETADPAKDRVGDDQPPRGNGRAIHEPQQKGRVQVFFAHEENGCLMKFRIPVLLGELGGQTQIVRRLGGDAPLKSGDQGGDAKRLLDDRLDGVVPWNVPIPDMARSEVIDPIGSGAKR